VGNAYEKLGLKVGVEIHQELDTHKLFCRCPSALREGEPSLVVARRLRPTQSELGEVDRAAVAEAIKGKEFRYQVTDNVCLVELDCEPPHPVNEEALDAALEIALLLNATPVDEAHVMRKIVIDGSNTTGFQRTILIATDGSVEVDGKTVSIPTICLEEDAARKVSEDRTSVDYRLDRLGIPLVEIATGPEFSDPQTPAKAALKIGRILRATGKVKRGIGTIRQDVNISIRRGARQEIKGIQELQLISTVVKREVERQVELLRIRDELRKRGAEVVKKDFVDVTDVFASTKSRVLRREIERGGRVCAVRLRGFAGLVGRELQPGRTFGAELADYARLYGGVGGIFHTDELPAYGISGEEVRGVRRAVGAWEGDAVVFVAGEPDPVRRALAAVVDRANQAMKGVPEETRRALPDGNTEFTRPLPGAARMYPETDIPPVVIARERVRRIERNLPELPEQRCERLIEQYGLSRELAERMSLSERADVFEELVERTRADPTLIATTLEETLVSLRRDGVPTENVGVSVLEELFNLVGRGKLAKEAVPEVLAEVSKGASVSGAIQKLGLGPLSKGELQKLVSEVVSTKLDFVRERGERAMDPLMGILMQKVRGRADGKLVHELLKRELSKVLKR